MDRVYKLGAVGTATPAPASPSTGRPTAGVPGTVPATEPGAYWYDMITEELRAVVVGGGITPSHTSLNQVLLAIQALIAGQGRPAYTYLAADWAWLDKGRVLRIQWGPCTDSGANPATTFPIAFSSACFSVVVVAQPGLDETPGVNGITVNGFHCTNTNGTLRTADYYIAIGV